MVNHFFTICSASRHKKQLLIHKTTDLEQSVDLLNKICHTKILKHLSVSSNYLKSMATSQVTFQWYS